MTVVKINTIGTGVSNDYQTIGHWWESVKTATSSNLVSDDRILIGRLSEGNHALPSSLIMYSGHVTTDASRYVILDVQDNRGFSGVLPLVTATQTANAFITGANSEWINCTVPYTQFRNFIIQPNIGATVNSSVNNYFFNVENTGLIDSVGIHHTCGLINGNNTGVRFEFNSVRLTQTSQIRNSVILSPYLTVSGTFPRCNFQLTAVNYADNCSVYNNSILEITGTVHVVSASQDSCRLELYGIRDRFTPEDIAGCEIWLDFDDVSTLYANNLGTSLVTTSGNSVSVAMNKIDSIPPPFGNPYDAFQTTSNRRMIWRPNYFNSRSCLYGLRGTANTNGSGMFIDSMLTNGLLNNGYSVFAFAAMESGSDSRQLFGHTTLGRQPIYFEWDSTQVLHNHMWTIDATDTVSTEITQKIYRLDHGKNPFRIYSSVVDVDALINPSGHTLGIGEFATSGTWCPQDFIDYWQESLDTILLTSTGRLIINGRQNNATFNNAPLAAWGEWIFYSRPLNSGEVYKIHRYLTDKWNNTTYTRLPNTFIEKSINISEGNVKNNIVSLYGQSKNNITAINKSYQIPHDDFSYNASTDQLASGLFPNNVNYTGISIAANLVDAANSSNINAHILQAAPLRGSGQNLSSIFNYDVDELPRSNNGWDVGADEWLFNTTGDTTLYIQGYSNNTGIIDFFIQGYSVNTGILDLFIQGYLQSSSNIDFTINGFLNQTGNIDLSIQGYLPKTGILDLSIVGYSTGNNNCPLHIYGYSPQNNSLNLSLVGYLQNSGNIPLTIQGYLPQTGNLDLFIRGNIADNYATTLCVVGKEVSNTGLPLWLVSHNTGNQGLDLSLIGFLNQTGTMDLSINGYLANNNSCNMTIVGSRTENSGLDLYIKGHQVSTGYCDLSIYGYDNKTGTLDLTINGNIVSDTFNTLPLTVIAYDVTNNYAPLTIVGNLQNNNNLNLNINGYDIQNNNIPLTIVGNLASDLSNNLNLILNGYLPKTGNLDMSLLGMLNSTNACPISIYGYDANNNNISMVVNGSQSTNNNIGFSISGVAGTNHNLNLFISGPVSTTGRSEDATLFIVGYDSQINNVPMFLFGPSYIVEGENVRDCMCDFEIPAELIDLHESGVGSLITNLGVPCTLYYPPKKTQCPNCEFDARTKKSANIYRAGGPISFTAGACPYCNGVGFKEEEASDNIQMSIYWSHRDWHDIGVQIEKPDGVIQSRGFIEDLPKIKKCNQMEPNLKTNQAIKYRYKLKGEPVPHGFRQQKYFLAFWERI